MYFDRIVDMENHLSKEEKSFASDMAKGLVSFCVRNNTVLEDVHAGVTELTDETMKRLMIECVDNIYVFIASLYFGDRYYCNTEEPMAISDFATKAIAGRMECKEWYDAKLPEWVKAIAEMETNPRKAYEKSYL